MTRIYLIRHGQASFAADDYDQLSDIGIKQSSILGDYLKQKHITPDVVMVGNMKRHHQTAVHSLESMQLSKSFTEDSRWNEYDHQNILAVYSDTFATPQGIRTFLANKKESRATFQKHFNAAVEKWVNDADNSVYNETWNQFTKRLISALDHLVEKYKDKTVFVYTSGGAISIAASLLLGLPLKQFICVNGILVNAGVTKVVIGGINKKMTISSLNEHHVFEQQGDKNLITYT